MPGRIVRHHLAVASLLSGLILSMYACGSDTVTSPDPIPVDPNVAGQVDATGGTLTAQGGAVSLTVPPGAVPAATTITAAPVAQEPADPNLVPGTMYDFGPDGLQFAQPVTLRLTYDPAAIPAPGSAEDLRIFKRSGAAWLPTANGSVDPATATVTGDINSFSQYAVVLAPCSRIAFSLMQSGEITATDCANAAFSDRFEDYYSISASSLIALSGANIVGAPRMQVSAASSMAGRIGLFEGTPDAPGRTHAVRDLDPVAGATLTVITGASDYSLFVAGSDPTELGSYDLTTTVSAAGTFACGDIVFIAGDVSFDSNISGANSCAEIIEFGPNVGDAINTHNRYAELVAGQSYTVTVSGIDPTTSTIALFTARFAAEGIIDDILDLGTGLGDTTRETTFTASVSGFYFLQVSSGTHESSDYTFSITQIAGPVLAPCSPIAFSLMQPGEIRTTDCANAAFSDRFEDYYSISASSLIALSGANIVGAPRMQVAATSSMAGRIGLFEGTPDAPGLTHAVRDLDPVAGATLTVITGASDYSLFVAGSDPTELGSYDLTTTVSAAGTFACGDIVFIAGDVSFDSNISGANSCAEIIEFGPNIGDAINTHNRYAELVAGQSYTVTVSGIDPTTSTIALFTVRFAPEGIIDDILDLGTGLGDTTRETTFTASVSGFYFLQVSSGTHESSDYTFSITTN